VYLEPPGGGEVIRAKQRSRESQNPNSLSWWQPPFDERDLLQRRCGDREAAARRQFTLIDRQKPAARSDPVGTVLDQFGAGGEESVE
jgi:hypothetical protein